MSIREQLAEFCFSLKYEDLPRAVVDFTRLLITDQIGLTIAGGRRHVKAQDVDIAGFFKQQGGKEESSLVAEGCKIPCINAAFANTTVSFGGFDGLHRSAVHLPCCLIPATIAVGERQKASGNDLILATVTGAEIITRVAWALGSDNAYNRGFHPTALSSPFGCAMATGKLIGLGRETLADALSIAATQAAGSSLWPQAARPTRHVRIQVGRAAQVGVTAALLAERGVVGADKIFEDPRGFLAGHSAQPNPARLTDGLGSLWEIKNTTLKQFGVGIYIIPGMEALLEMLGKNNVKAADIAHLTLRLPNAVIPLVGSPIYPKGASSSVSGRYVLAVTAYKGEKGMLFSREYQNEDQVNDPRYQELFKRIDVVGDSELDKSFPGKWPCTLTLKTKDGREWTEYHDRPVKGEPGNPLTAEDIETRFMKVVEPVLPRQKCDRMLELLRSLEKVTDISELASLMATKSQGN